MDILRKELNEIYSSQALDREHLDRARLDDLRATVRGMADISGGCCVITDASNDTCHVYGGSLARMMGWAEGNAMYRVLDSSDEDFIYNCLHPEDLPEKRLLEYEFFKRVDNLSGPEKIEFKATCRIRIKDRSGRYVWVNNSTQILQPSLLGKIWLILCTYELASDQSAADNIAPCIRNSTTGEITVLSFRDRKSRILSQREKEILALIKDGKSSKMIADELNISINTVNRHRQNILEKLSVANSFEAIAAAESMGLL